MVAKFGDTGHSVIMKPTLLCIIIANLGCASDLIAHANADCASQANHCAGKTASGTLYLDTGNLPSVTDQSNQIMLCALPVEGVCDAQSLTIRFEGGPLTADIDPGIADETAWKVRFEGLTTTWTDPPGMLSLAGRLRQLEFIFDENEDHPVEFNLD